MKLNPALIFKKVPFKLKATLAFLILLTLPLIILKPQIGEFKQGYSSLKEKFPLTKSLGNSEATLVALAPSPTEVPIPTLTSTPTPTTKPTAIPTKVPTTPTQAPIKPTSIPVVINNNPPSSGFSKQSVQTSSGTFSVLIISADLNSTRVIVDTASNSDCSNDCPVLSLGDYVSRSGAFAGINGAFFCPASYPSCAGKTNSFDTLLMNKNKTYFNSANNVYSVVPAVIFSGNSARFVSQSLEWGRDTGVDAVIANHPLLTFNGQVAFGGSGDAKLSSKGARNFIGAKDNTVYIGSVLNATTAEAAQVLQTMGINNSLGLDQGGSTALWFGGYEQSSSLGNRGYKLGPGRGIPNAVLLVRK